MKYNIGDKVRIKSDLINNEIYGDIGFVVEMEKYMNKEAYIKDFYGALGYTLDIPGRWVWSDEMLEDITEKSDINKNIALEMAKTMTREEFLKQSKGKCPSKYGLVGNIDNTTCSNFNDCDSCRAYAIKDIFFIGDKVIRQNGMNFSNGEKIATITKIEKSNCGDYKLIWFNNNLGYARENEITLYEGDDKSQFIFNLGEFKLKDIAIQCETKEEAEKLSGILIMNGIDNYEIDIIRKGYSFYGYKTCYNIDNNKIFYGDVEYYSNNHYKVIRFSETDFSQTYNKESIDKVALNNDINKYTFREIITAIKESEKFTDGMTNISMNDNKIKIETFNGDSQASYTYGDNYREFIKIKETKQVTICKVSFVTDTDKLKEFALNSNDTIVVGDMVECYSGSYNLGWQYARVKEVEIKDLTEDEFVGYKVCRKLSN